MVPDKGRVPEWCKRSRPVCSESNYYSLVARSAKRCVWKRRDIRNSDLFLAGRGRIGVTMIAPAIPVFPFFDSLRAADAHTIENATTIVNTRTHIVIHLLCRIRFSQNIPVVDRCIRSRRRCMTPVLRRRDGLRSGSHGRHLRLDEPLRDLLNLHRHLS